VTNIVCFSGDTPEVIGEASLLMAQTCFPNEGLDGGTGHNTVDVLCEPFVMLLLQQLTTFGTFPDVVFGQQVPSGVGQHTIDIAALKALGDKETKKLATALGV
jgi:chitosanase